MLDKRGFSPGRSRLGTALAILTLIGGIGLLIRPYWFYGWMVTILPWGTLLLALAWGWSAFVTPAGRRARRRRIILTILAAVFSGILFYRPDWRDGVLWYLFIFWLILTGAVTLRPALRPGVEKQQLWRWAGCLTVLGLALLMLLKPRSGLSEALTLLGYFSTAWGIYMLAIPPARE